MDYEPNFGLAFEMLKEMRGIVRSGDFTKPVRNRWSTEVDLTEIMLMGLQADARRSQPIKADKYLTELASIIRALKAGEALPGEARLAVATARSFFRRAESGTLRDHGSRRLKQLVEELRLFQREHLASKTSSEQEQE